MDEYNYYLPNEKQEPIKYTTQNNSVIIIGANGAGKSKLGAWMEKKSINNIHRIGAQRSLVFNKYISQKSYEQAINLLQYGTESNINNSHDRRWNYHDGQKFNFTASLLNDYEHALSALLAKKAKDQESFITECRKHESNKEPHDPVPQMVTDTLQKIWKSVFPQRDVSLYDAKVTAIFTNNGEKKEYNGIDMSDGERVALYLIAQALCIPPNKTIIIDEPEIHLHNSIMNKLWTAIENERQDCLFIYITHDIRFAANHRQAKKIWVKNFDGEKWELEHINESDLPEELLLNILGNRKPVLFVEGAAESYDTKLYTEIYDDYYVVPCDGCSNVINNTKAMKNNIQLHHLKCFGIIDHDYRSEHEIKKYESENIYVLKVAEVENLFLVEELLETVGSLLSCNNTDERVNKIKDYIINERFANQIYSQIYNAIVAEIKYKLSTAEISKKSESDIKKSIDDLFNSTINYELIKTDRSEPFSNALENKDFKQVLYLFNQKSLPRCIAKFFDFDDDGYCDFIIRKLSSDSAEEIKKSIIPYLPKEIPLNLNWS